MATSSFLQLTSLSDRYVSHFETDGPHVLLYFDSVSGEKSHRRGHWVLDLYDKGQMWQVALENPQLLPHVTTRLGL